MMSKKILIIGGTPQSLMNFRGKLIESLVEKGHTVIAMAASAPSSIIARLNDIGAEFIPIPIHRNSLNPIHDLKTLIALYKNLVELDPDIVLAYTIKPVIWSGIALRLWRKKRARFVALITGLGIAFQKSNENSSPIQTLVVKLYSVSLKRACKVIFQNIDDLNEFVENKITPESNCIVVQGSGIDLDHFSMHPLPNNRITFLTIGRLLRSKGFLDFFEAAKIVKQKYPNTNFRIVGPHDSSPDRIPVQTIESWNTNDWVQYGGELEDVRDEIRNCSVFVLASYYPEGVPRTLLEALSIGRPILTTDTPGCRETVINNENGILFEKQNVADLAEKMMTLLENKNKWKSMGLKSRELAEQKFDVNLINSQIIHCLEN